MSRSLFCTFLGIALTALALNAKGESASQTTTPNPANAIQASQPFNFATSLRYSRTAFESNETRKQERSLIVLSPSYQFKYLRAAFDFGGTWDLMDSHNSQMIDGSLQLVGNPLVWNQAVAFTTSFGMTAPMSKNSIERESLLTSTSLGFQTAFIGAREYIPRLIPFIGVQFVKNSHTYKEATDGSVNASWANAQSLGLSYSWKYMSFSVSGNRSQTWSYQGTGQEYFSHSESVGVRYSKQVSFSFGHSISSPWYTPNGSDTNFKAIDLRSSVFFAGLTYLFN